ncbi:hypothetical protein QTO34_017109 [Cnephaeus nilssonii]|uniref:CCHC-type domain-containing protein n=1 Tax=Cnephaeus nilssonii TaxID=3371016 RepID=A0AA40I0E5_CNENI|nr:hypothetical protein QTO34_017109 [Eptesicus nilssonii]
MRPLQWPRVIRNGYISMESFDFLSFANETCPWFPEEGTVNFQMWEKVGKHLRDRYTAEGPEKIPIPTLTLWSLIHNCLDPAQESLRMSKQVKSLSDKDLPPKYERELEFEEERDKHHCERDDSDEEDFARSFAKMTLAAQPLRLEAGNFHTNNVFLTADLMGGKMSEFKTSVSMYGPTSFVLSLLDSVASEALPPLDWQTLAKACLSPGDYLMWKSNWTELSAEQAARNQQHGIPIILKMSRKKEQLRVAWGVFVGKLRDSYTPGEGGGLLDGVPLTGQPPLQLWLDPLPELWARMGKPHHLERKSGSYRKPENPQLQQPLNSWEPQNTSPQLAQTCGFKGALHSTTERSDFARDKMTFPLQAYQQINVCGTKAWRGLLTKGEKSIDITKVIEGPEEPYQDFVARRQNDWRSRCGSLLVKHLAFENANRTCQEALCPYKKRGSISDFIRICADIGPAYVQGVTLAAALKEALQSDRSGGTGKEICFTCGKPGLCPRCLKGKHWANDCRSQTDINGQPLDPHQGNSKGQVPNSGDTVTHPSTAISSQSANRPKVGDLYRATPGSAGLDLCPEAE